MLWRWAVYRSDPSTALAAQVMPALCVALAGALALMWLGCALVVAQPSGSIALMPLPLRAASCLSLAVMLAAIACLVADKRPLRRLGPLSLLATRRGIVACAVIAVCAFVAVGTFSWAGELASPVR